jgi:hypothetical protein
MERRPAWIIDRDGTLASVGFSRTFLEGDRPDWASFNACIPFDAPVPEVVELVRSAPEGVVRIMTTGRSEDFRPQMSDWLHKHQIPIDLLLMRRSRDMRPDDVVKEEIYRTLIEPHFEVLRVIDDRESVCAMWRRLGLNLTQVVDPEIPPPILARSGK